MREAFQLSAWEIRFDNARSRGGDVTAMETAGYVTVNFVVTLSGRSDSFIRFLNNFETTFLKRGERVNLIISYFSSATPSVRAGGSDESEKSLLSPDEEEAFKDAKFFEIFVTENVAQMQWKYPENKIEVNLWRVKLN